MAEAIGLGASIIGIAGAGVSVVTALTKFGISYKDSNNKINELAARVSLTATILQAIGDTVKENEEGFKREAFMVTWKEVLNSCAWNYEKIQTAIWKAKGKEAIKGRPARLSTWGKLKWAVGGEDSMKTLEDSLEKSSQQVLMMQQVIQLTAIKLLGKSGQAPVGADLEKKELMGKMDWIITGLVNSGMINLDIDRCSANIAAMQIQGERPVNHHNPYSSEKPRGPDDNHDSRETADDTPPGPFFEAYFIAPQSIARDLPDGIFGITDRPSDSYTTLMLDTSLNLSSLQATLLEAESRGNPKSQKRRIKQIFSALPQAVMEQILWVSKLRHEHSNNVAWDIVEIVKMAYHPRPGQAGVLEISSNFDDQLWGFLVVLRGQVGGTPMIMDFQNELFVPGAILKETRASIRRKDEMKEGLQEEMEELRSKRLEAIRSNDTQQQEQLEQRMAETAELFQDLSSIVVEQGATADETTAPLGQQYTENIDKRDMEIGYAIVHKRRARRRRWLFPLLPFLWAADNLGKIGTGSVGSKTNAEETQSSSNVDETKAHVSTDESERLLDNFISTFSTLG